MEKCNLVYRYQEHMSAGAERLFRSAALPRGWFRQVGNIHLHIDGGRNSNLVLQSLQEMERRGRPSKLNIISEHMAGAQRREVQTTFASHTPGTGSEEEFEYFSTTHLKNRQQAIESIRAALVCLANIQGIVVEVEQVVGKVENGLWSESPFVGMEPIEPDEVGFEASRTLPLEVHHAFEIARTHSPIKLRQLVQDTEELGIKVGGWFRFTKEDVEAYRSNAFFEFDGIREHVLKEHRELTAYLNSKKLDYRIHTLVERVMGIWRTPTPVLPTFKT